MEHQRAGEQHAAALALRAGSEEAAGDRRTTDLGEEARRAEPVRGRQALAEDLDGPGGAAERHVQSRVAWREPFLGLHVRKADVLAQGSQVDVPDRLAEDAYHAATRVPHAGGDIE